MPGESLDTRVFRGPDFPEKSRFPGKWEIGCFPTFFVFFSCFPTKSGKSANSAILTIFGQFHEKFDESLIKDANLCDQLMSFIKILMQSCTNRSRKDRLGPERGLPQSGILAPMTPCLQGDLTILSPFPLFTRDSRSFRLFTRAFWG